MLVPASGVRAWAFPRVFALCTQRENRGIGIVLLLILGFQIYKTQFLVFPDLAYTYPHLSYDGFQWLADGLYYAGYDVTPWYRNPGLPLIFAALSKLGIPEYLPALAAGLQLTFFLYLTLILRRHFSPGPVALTLAFFFFNFSIHGFFEDIMADGWAVTTQLVAFYHLDLARDRLRHLVPAAFWLAVSFLFQYAVGCLLPCLVFYGASDLWRRRESTRQFLTTLTIAIGVAAAVALPFLLYRWVEFGNPFHSKVIQFPLFGFHFFGLFYYGVNYFAFFGIPAATLAIYGATRSFKDDGVTRFFLLALANYVMFWVFLYQWHDPRFFLYFVPFVAFFFAVAVRDLSIMSLFSRRTASAQQLVAAYFLTPVFLLYGLHVKDSAYVSNELPLSPQNILLFSKQRVTHWGGNETISVKDMNMSNITTHVPALDFFRKPREERTSPLPGLEASRELAAVDEAARNAAGVHYTIAVCGTLPRDYPSSMRRILSLRRDLGACGGGATLALVAATDTEAIKGTTLYEGKSYRLVKPYE